ncbi:hypothetical protein [Streptomyces sp. Wb2n-11]|uniref:hypothetical protein n=1 Tax=Streptomyces sp. Wb2n-11 TaxID=1030533 RepID=UPI000A9FB06B|nr:hypothetical protein [Streptomyces sp. Wb2n-11]
MYRATRPASDIADLGPLLASVGKQLLTVPGSFADPVISSDPSDAIVSYAQGPSPRALGRHSAGSADRSAGRTILAGDPIICT